VPVTSAVGLYPYSQSGGVESKPFRQLRKMAGYLMSRTIPVVWQCAQGVDASDKGFLRSHSQTQAWSLVL
jgi:hypothetical protein